MRAIVASALIAAACSTPRATSSTPEQSASSKTATPPSPPLDLTTASPWPAEYQSDVLWSRAARGDALDRHALAQREAAHGLLSALALGGELGRTALAALPHAPDAREARAPLCALIANASAPTREWLLTALHSLLLPDAARASEPDLEADKACRERLAALAADGSLAPAEHDLVTSALAYVESTAPR